MIITLQSNWAYFFFLVFLTILIYLALSRFFRSSSKLRIYHSFILSLLLWTIIAGLPDVAFITGKTDSTSGFVKLTVYIVFYGGIILCYLLTLFFLKTLEQLLKIQHLWQLFLFIVILQTIVFVILSLILLRE